MIEYDPIKDTIGGIVRRRRWTRRTFYRALDLIFLRAWYVQRAVNRIFMEMKSEDPGRKRRVLDAGSGFGQYSYFIARRYQEALVTSVDVKEDYLADCISFFEREGLSGRVHFYEADLTEPGMPPFDQPGNFDLILSVDVMEHIRDDMAVFQNFAYALRDGGYVLINTPSDLGGSGVTERGMTGFIGEHVRDGYNRLELETKLREAGLEPVRSEYGYGKYGAVAWRFLVKWPMQLLGFHRLLALVLPFYYLPMLPAGLVLNMLDLQKHNRVGAGLTVIARKNSSYLSEDTSITSLHEMGL